MDEDIYQSIFQLTAKENAIYTDIRDEDSAAGCKIERENQNQIPSGSGRRNSSRNQSPLWPYGGTIEALQ